jgi:acyl-CoA reductase-like NAD-dependent aldehyde dehydrogenase
VLAPRSRYDEVVDTLAAFASSMAVGDALDPATQIGPMASQTHRDRVEGYIARGKQRRRPAGCRRRAATGPELGPGAISAYQQLKSIYA